MYFDQKTAWNIGNYFFLFLTIVDLQALIQVKIKVRKSIIYFGQETPFWLKSSILQSQVTMYNMYARRLLTS